VGSASDYGTPFGSASERYDGWVSVDERTFAQHAHSDVEFTLRFDATDTTDAVVATTRSVMDLATREDSYDLRIHLTVSDDGEIIRERTWVHTFPRA
jgi:hypothetical protein